MKEISYLESKGFIFAFLSCAIVSCIGYDLYVNRRIGHEFAITLAGQLMGQTSGIFSTIGSIRTQKTSTYFEVKAISHLFLSFAILSVIG